MNGSYKRTLYCKECKREIKICNSNPCSFKLNNKYLRLINRNTQFGIDETSNVQSSSPEHTNLIVPKPQDNNFNLQDLEKEITAIETENHPTNPHTNQETPPNPHQDPPKDTETPNQSEGQQETPSSNPTPPPNSASFQNSKPKRRFDKEKEFQPKYRRDYKVNGYKAEVSGKRSKKYQPKQNGKYVVKDPQHHLIKEPNLQETDYTYDNGYYQHHPHNYFYHYDTSEIVSNLGQINDQRFIMNVHTQMPQINLIFYLNQTYKFACKSHFVCVVGYDVHGMVVEMSVSTPEMEWRLNDLRILWFDFPWEVSSLHPDTRLALSLSRVPAGSIFKARVIELTDKTIRLAPSKYSNPILKISDRMPRYRNFERCPFRYLIIMDFEATCDYCPQPKVTAKTAEIIEFPWIVIDTETLQIVDERQIYVKPDFLDGVTLYTTKLTGITKDILINQKPLRNAIQMFDGYLKNKFGITSPYGKDFRIVTDGIWDLQVQLLKEAEKKNINTEWYYKQYFDIKEEFRKFLPWFPETFKPTLTDMLKALSLEFIGKPHKGIDDSRNIAQIVLKMLALGHQFSSPKTIPPNYDPYLDPNFVDFGSHTEPDAWKCSNRYCNLWNRPWFKSCRFCQYRRPTPYYREHNAN